MPAESIPPLQSPRLSLLRVLGFIYCLFALLFVALTTIVLVFFIYTFFALLPMYSGGSMPGAASWQVYLYPALSVLFYLLLGGIPAVLCALTGMSLLATKRYYLCLITSFLILLAFPVGTLVGGFAIWLLFQREIKLEFARSGPSEAL